MKEWTKTQFQNLIRRDTGLYYVQVTVGGKQFRRSLGTKKLDIAKMKLGKELLKLRAMKPSKEAGCLKDSIEKWWEHKQMVKSMRPETVRYWKNAMAFVLERLDGSVKLSNSAAMKWWAEDVRDQVSHNYANNMLSMMSAVMQGEVDAGLRSVNPFYGVKRLKVEINDLKLPSRDQFREIVKHVRAGTGWSADESADMLEFIAYSGLRRGEVNALLWDDVHDEEIVVRGDVIESKGHRAGTKSGKIRRVPMSQQLSEVVSKRRAVRVSDKVFNIINPKKSLSNACAAVGCANLTPHDLRHLFATVCIESGVDIFTVAKWLGHQDGGVLAMKTYGHLRDEHSQRQMRGVEF
jgi:integrase